MIQIVYVECDIGNEDEFTSDPNNKNAFDGSLQWEGMLRKLDRLEACYKL